MLSSVAMLSSMASVPPHLIMTVIDDLGWSDVGYHNPDLQTPNINRLASEGVKLERYYVQQVCSPTRSALMTARYPFRTGLQHAPTLVPGSTGAIPSDTATIAEVLKKRGYATSAIGKWHLGYSSWKDTPLGRGFDSYAGFLQGGQDYYTHELAIPPPLNQSGFDLWRNQTVAWDVRGTHSTPFFMDEAARVLDAHDPATPLFVYLSLQEVHAPLEETPDEPSRAACVGAPPVPSPLGPKVTAFRHTLCEMAANVDSFLGDFVSRLEAKGMWNHTLFWLTTDNGGMTYGSAALGLPPVAVGVSSNWPLRGGKTTLFEGGVRGVSFVSGGIVPVTARGTTVEGLMQHVDVPLTMAKLAQANWTLLCDDGMCDALDMWPTIMNRAPSPRLEAPINVDTCVGPAGGGPPCSTESKFNALISARGADGLWKLIEANWQAPQCPNTTWCTGAGGYDGWWTNDPYRHIAQNNSTQAALPDPTLSGGGIWLFDLVSDPNEAVNMASSRPEIVTSLRARLEMFAQPSNGYRDPQLNIPHPRAYPSRHNGTWAPFVSDGATLPPQSTDYLKSVAGILEHASWD